MKHLLFSLTILFGLYACQDTVGISSSVVSNAEELNEAIKNAEAGTDIVMSNGVWKDVEIKFKAIGTENNPITLRAETPGEVLIEGQSNLKIGGKYLIVDGLYFKNGYSPSSAVIDFRTDEENIAFNCKVTNCVIEGFNKMQRNETDLWVRLRGRHNELSNSYLAGKSNRGPTVRVDLEGIESINNYHRITNNHFGPRPPKGGPSAETIQIGNSFTSMSPSYTMVADNLFERCNGEVEVISSKTNFNEFRNNVFYKSEGSLVTRHGNYCTVDGNYFIGDEESEQIGGVRLIGTGHWVTNNYFYKLKGEAFRSPLAVMNGIPKSPLNRYIQVTDVVVAYNSWIDCVSPLQFGVGSNVDQKDVLPASEIRSARPIRTTVANNLIYNTTADSDPVIAHDELDGINFQNNIINNQGSSFKNEKTLASNSFSVSKLTENLILPATDVFNMEAYVGFDFETISADLFGAKRSGDLGIGAVFKNPGTDPEIMDKSKYGPEWFTSDESASEGKTHTVANANDLVEKIAAAAEGDVITLTSGDYAISSPLKIDKALRIESDPSKKARIIYKGEAGSPAFEMHPKGQLTLKNIELEGGGRQMAFASLKSNMSSLYNLIVDQCKISNFDFILKAYKYSFAEHIHLKSSTFENCNNGLELSEEIEDKGEYNAENIVIDACTFSGIKENVIDYYRGGYDESTVGGNLVLSNSTFSNCGASEKNGTLLNTYGIINVDITGNTFTNNRVKDVAVLWGAKNNSAKDNIFANSPKIRTEENLKLKLLY